MRREDSYGCCRAPSGADRAAPIERPSRYHAGEVANSWCLAHRVKSDPRLAPLGPRHSSASLTFRSPTAPEICRSFPSESGGPYSPRRSYRRSACAPARRNNERTTRRRLLRWVGTSVLLRAQFFSLVGLFIIPFRCYCFGNVGKRQLVMFGASALLLASLSGVKLTQEHGAAVAQVFWPFSTGSQVAVLPPGASRLFDAS